MISIETQRGSFAPCFALFAVNPDVQRLGKLRCRRDLPGQRL
jgi:hypothetical protein